MHYPFENLYPFQREAVKKMREFLNTRGCCYNASDMGTGKCAMTLATFDPRGELDVKSVVIVCPASVRAVWFEEIKTWWAGCCVDFEIFFDGKNPGRYRMGDTVTMKTHVNVIIVSYDLTRSETILKHLIQCKPGALILDESHKCNNRKAARTQVCLGPLWNKAKYKVCLSGTPFTTRIVDGFQIFSKMLPENAFFQNFFTFAGRYSESETKTIHIRLKNGPAAGKVITKNIVDYHGIKNAEELSKILRSNFYLRYKKEDVLKQLPAKVYQIVPLDAKLNVGPTTKSEKEQIELELHLLRKALEEGKQFTPPKCLGSWHRLQGEAKVQAVVDFVSDIAENQKVVVFAHHRNVIAGLYDALTKQKFEVVVLNGETPGKKRSGIIKQFQEGSAQIFIGQYDAAGIGTTLTAASVVILAELPGSWSPGTLDQAVDRCHRIGQRDSVLVNILLVPGSVDYRIWPTIKTRDKEFKKVLG